jgi:hypothetical protein
MLKLFLKWLTGDLAGALTRAYEVKLNSNVESEKTRADVIVKDLEAQMEGRRQATQIRLATAGFWEMRVLTFLIAAPFVLHLSLVALDTCFGLAWGIAAFPAPFDDWEGTILLSFFGVQVAGKALDTAAFIFGKK